VPEMVFTVLANYRDLGISGFDVTSGTDQSCFTENDLCSPAQPEPGV